MAFFGRTSCDLQVPYKVDPNPWKQHQNWLAIERWATYFSRNCLPAATGGARPYATLVVAAANSVATDHANADYICSGIGTDDVTIQAALDDLDLVGGTVVLLEGSYYCASGPDAFTPSILVDGNQVLRGQGRNNTFLYFDSGSTMGLLNAGELRDLTITLGTPGGA